MGLHRIRRYVYFDEAKNALFNARNCPDGVINPFILLRLGQSCLECNELENAKEFLLRAYMLKGDDIFLGEKEKYFELIEDIV